MRAAELVRRAVDIAENRKTLYVMGCFGAPLTAVNKARYTQNHPYNRQSERTKLIEAASADTFGFDCVCLIKGILWGWDGDLTAAYGGARYGSNGVPDIGADAMLNACPDASAAGWDRLDPGEAVGMSGHIGLYIGDGLAVECTPAWENRVQITAVGNIGRRAGYPTRTWERHGHLPYVDYEEDDMDIGKLTDEEILALARRIDEVRGAQPVHDWDDFPEAWDKAVKDGVFDGTGPQNPVTREQLAVLRHRRKL